MPLQAPYKPIGSLYINLGISVRVNVKVRRTDHTWLIRGLTNNDTTLHIQIAYNNVVFTYTYNLNINTILQNMRRGEIMQTRTYKFITDKNNYSLFSDLPILAKSLIPFREASSGKFSVVAHITVITKLPTKIKFDVLGEYQDMMFDKIYDSDGYDIFGDVLIQDTGVSGEITISFN